MMQLQVATNREVLSRLFKDTPECLAVMARHLIIGTGTGNVVCTDHLMEAPAQTKRVHSCNIKDMIIHDGLLYTCSLDGLTKCIDIETFKLVSILQGVHYGWHHNSGIKVQLGPVCGVAIS